jgi:LysR family transcriptional regulator, glycine cleavage system transcriptional activator
MSRRLPSLTALRAFEAAARHLSFARAAEELHVTPAAISQHVKQLEDYLGRPLFRRGKSLALSNSAAEAVGLVTEAFDRLERAVERLRVGHDDGPLVVSTPPTFASRWLVSRLDDFQSRYPEIELRLHATRRLVDFALEDVDMAVRFGSGPYGGLHVDRLMPEAIVPVAAPALAAKVKLPADLAGCTLLQDDSQDWDPTFPDWDTWLASLDVPVDKALRVRHLGDSNLVIEAAVSGLGVGLVWSSLVADAVRAGRLVQLLGKSLATDHGYHLVTLPNRLEVPKIAAFRTWMLEQAKGLHAP